MDKITENKQSTAPVILVIDDDVQFQNFMSDLLGNEGYKVHAAFDGEEGFKKYDQFQPHLIITDIVMPKKEGLELIMAIREKNTKTPILAVSGGNTKYGSKYLRVAGKFGVNAVFEKPFDSKKFLVSVNEHITSA